VVHDQLAEPAAAYALGVLPSPERQDFEVHLAGCAVCAAEVRGLRAVAAALADLAPAAEPSAGVRDRLLAAVSGR
jgi:anti-sigma factor RsiW